MLPPAVLTDVRELAEHNSALHLEFQAKGGHAGFVAGSRPWRPFYYAEYRVGEFFANAFAEASYQQTAAVQRSR
jgi:hypothetical protein